MTPEWLKEHLTESKINEIRREVSQIHKEIALKGTKHPCFKGFILYDEDLGAYLGKETVLGATPCTIFSNILNLDMIHVYDGYEEVFRIRSSRKSPTYIAQLFNINNELFCHFNV